MRQRFGAQNAILQERQKGLLQLDVKIVSPLWRIGCRLDIEIRLGLGLQALRRVSGTPS